MIYFIRDAASGHIKIGHGGDPWKRLSNIQIGCPGVLEMVAVEDGDAKREAELHATFADARLRGEWFAPSLPLQAHIASLGPPPARPLSKRKSRAFWGGMTDEELSRHVNVHRATLTRLRQRKGERARPALAIQIQRATGRSAIELAFGEDAAEALAAHGLSTQQAA